MNHPLFPNAPEDDKREIAWIHVTRFERTGQIWFPRAFKAEELAGLDDIAGMFGGGTYELIGRAASTKSGGVGVIIDRLRVTLPGEPLPFAPADEAPAGAGQPMPTLPMGGGGGNDMQTIVLAMMQMQQSAQQQQSQLMATMFQASSQQTAAIVTALAGRNDGGGAAEMIKAMGELQKAHTESMAKLYEGRGGGGGSSSGDGDSKVEALIQGMELGKSIGESVSQEPSDLAVVMQGFTAAMNAPKPDRPPPGLGANGNGKTSS